MLENKTAKSNQKMLKECDLEQVIEQMRKKAIESGTLLNGKRLSRKIYNFRRFGMVDDYYTTLDQYYINYINDALHYIRKNETAHVFKLEHIQEIMRFEPYIDVSIQNGMFCVTLQPSKRAKKVVS